jgi:uncharacterized protein (DUF983 family)
VVEQRHRSSLATKVGRALLLRCPRCGARHVFASWTKMLDRCPVCGLALQRGEDQDFWLGAYAINLVVAEGIAAVVAFVVLWLTWPAWGPAQWVGIGLAIVMPYAFYPFSRLLWLGADLHFRPGEAGDDAR